MKLLIQLQFCLLATALSSFITANAQGLDAHDVKTLLGGTLPLIVGKSDKDRWDRLLSIQSSLIGMKFNEVQNLLGTGKADPYDTLLWYKITESKLPSTPGNLAHIVLTVKFDKKGSVRSFQIVAMYWQDERGSWAADKRD